MPITALFAGLLSVLFLVLSVRVIGVRRAERVEIGAGESRELLRRMRVHANFAEYAPLSLVLMGLAESLRAPAVGIAAIGLVLLIGRLIHAWGLSQSPHNVRLRVGGMVLTFTALGAAAALCMVYGGPVAMRALAAGVAAG